VPAAAELRIEVRPTAASVAERAAELIVKHLREDVARDGRATLAVSGGRTPRHVFELLAAAELPWQSLDLFQVDERVAPAGHADRNATQAAAAFARAQREHPSAFHWMPVEDVDLDEAARRYAQELQAAAGSPPRLGVVHLGLGADGHTASLFPGSPLLDAAQADVAVAPEHLGRRRMTLTFDVLNAARRVLWIVTGTDKQAALAGLVEGDPAIVGSRIRRSGALVLADADAAALVRDR
jgi:6-phosphogluconolactonase